MWIHNYEIEIENIAEEFGLDYEEAELKLEAILEKDPSYLDDYSNLYIEL